MKGVKPPGLSHRPLAERVSCGAGAQPGPAAAVGAQWRGLNGSAEPPLPQLSPAGKSRRKYRPPDVRTIFSSDTDPGVREEAGDGHTFTPRESDNAWCDHCCHFILGQCLRCTACKYTCHTQCQDFVQLDCQQNGKSTDPTSCSENTVQESPRNGQDVEKPREPPKVLTKEEIKQKIHVYNAEVTDRLKMTLSLSSDTYTGFIKVQMDLRRPITVRPMANQGINAYNNNNNETAFYIPKGIVNTLHISSSNTAKEVIVALLRKFLVADNPAKFALFKESKKDEQVLASKLLDTEHPLYMCLLAGPSAEGLNFILREHETGEVLWEAFSLPELKNFLRILDKEEKEHFRVICKRYAAYRERLQEALREAGKPG